MKVFHLIIIWCLAFSQSYGQSDSQYLGKIDVEISKENRKNINAQVAIKSDFPGGDSSLVQSIQRSLNQSRQLRKISKRGQYIISLEFIVDQSGFISDVKVQPNYSFGIEDEIVRVLKRNVRPSPSSQGVLIKPYRTSSSTPQ